MIAYFDTSALVPLLIEEPKSSRAERLWDEAERVVAVRLCYAEARAALAMALRTDRIRRTGLRTAVDILEELYDALDLVEVTDAIVRRAGALADEHDLRGYDAVHLAAAETLSELDVVFVSGDGRLCDAAATSGIAVGRLGG